VIGMTKTRGERLRIAREHRGFKSARLAAQAMGVAVSTYGAHERAEAAGGRDYGPDEAKRYARRFGVTPEWLLTGWGHGPGEDPNAPLEERDLSAKVPVLGYVGAGSTAHFYDVHHGELDEVPPPEGASESTVAVEIRGHSMGPFFNHWLVFYDNVQRPVTDDMVGDLCMVGLKDGRVLLKQIQASRMKGLFNLISATEKPIENVAIEWAARVNSMSRRPR
jgi:hypothetical protein